VVDERVLSPEPPRAQEGDKRGPLAASNHSGIAGVAGRKAGPRFGRSLDPMHRRRGGQKESLWVASGEEDLAEAGAI